MKQLTKKIKMTTTITAITGLHIGGSSDNVEIGGIDLPVIKLATKDNQPYIPGSSLKGKMRCLLEQTKGAAKIGENPKVNNLFGFSENKIPSKLIVRDAMLTPDSKDALLACDYLDMPYTENKTENTIDRKEGATIKGGIRTIERVPAGAVFNAEFILNIWGDDKDKEEELMALFMEGIRLLENDYLGGSGSRGYGQIKFGEFTQTELSDANDWKA